MTHICAMFMVGDVQLISLYINEPFDFKCCYMPSGTKKFRKSIEPESHQTAKCFLSSSSSSSWKSTKKDITQDHYLDFFPKAAINMYLPLR